MEIAAIIRRAAQEVKSLKDGSGDVRADFADILGGGSEIVDSSLILMRMADRLEASHSSKKRKMEADFEPGKKTKITCERDRGENRFFLSCLNHRGKLLKNSFDDLLQYDRSLIKKVVRDLTGSGEPITDCSSLTSSQLAEFSLMYYPLA